jgi:hypothetical protein
MLLTSTFLRLTGNVFAWEAALHKYMDRDIAPKEMLLTKDEGLKMADIIFRLPAALLPVGRTKHHPHCPLPGARRPPLGGEGDASPGGRWGGSQAPGGDGTRVRRVREDPRHRVGTDARPRVGDWEAHPSSGSMGIGEDPRHPRNL